jgi:hypothetical protein
MKIYVLYKCAIPLVEERRRRETDLKLTVPVA